ncbi:MAG: PhzF family phenazine biosynthesis protein [Terracidiphilus sp.]|jgi:trans-2,3-dihydro-3-hydroxyanthranilate isomerase
MELDYFIVDVFAGTALEGNPLAVVINSVGLTAEKMQAIAREFNLSETTFVERRPVELERAEGVRVRIFTTQEELPFAGHPTLGTASVLKLHFPDAAEGATVRLALNVGTVPVRFGDAPEGVSGLFGEMTQRDAEFGAKLAPGEAAWLVGLAETDLDTRLPPQIVSTGTAFAIVALRSHAALERLQVSQREATHWLRERGARWFYVLAPTGATEPAWRARMQFEGGEDPATGSAAGCAIAYLVRHNVVASGERILLRQGVEIGRPSDLYLSARLESKAENEEHVKVTDIHVAGSTVLVAKGRLFLS